MPLLTGGWGAVSHQQARVGIYRAIACRYYRPSPQISTVPLYFIFNHGNKFTGTHIQRICNFPESFKICLLIPVLNHRQVSAGNSRKSAQYVLGYAFFVAETAYRPPNRTIVELHRLTPLSQQIVYEKT